MEAFGFVHPVVGAAEEGPHAPTPTGTTTHALFHATELARARMTTPPPRRTSPRTPGRTPTPTPVRSSPRLQELQAATPTPRQLHQIEQAELSRALSTRRTRSVTTSIRSKNQSPHRADQNASAAQPEEADRSDASGGASEDGASDSDFAPDDEEVAAGDKEEEAGSKEQETSSDEDSAIDDQVEAPGGKVRPGLVQVSEDPVFSPPMQEYHDNWTAWNKYKVAFMRATFQVFVVKESVSIKKRNGQLRSQINPTEPLLSEDMEMYERIYVCTHGPKPKQKEEKKNTNDKDKKKEKEKKKTCPFRYIRYTDCPIRFRVQWCHDAEAGWRLRVKPGCMWHNHHVNPKVYGTYPVARGIKDADSVQRAREMVQDGAAPNAVYDAMLSRGEQVYKADIKNFIAALRTEHGDDNEETARIVDKLTREDPDAVVTVCETDQRKTGVVSISTKHMRGVFSRFGELLLVDCTHKTNRNNYQLCTFMVMDEFGCGQVVQQSLLETNSNWHMEMALEHLKRANPESYKLLRVIIVDKDMNEVKVLERAFPEASVLLCHFHVVKYLAGVKHKPEFGKLSADDHGVVDGLVHRLIYSASETEFTDNKVAFMLACERLGFSAFADYVDRNWFDCTKMWVLYERNKLPHLKNHTNNRLESWFGKFKEGVKDSSTMAQCVQALLNEARRCENEYELANNRPGRYHNENYDEEMSNVLLCSTPYVAKLVEPQYTAAVNKDYAFELLEDDKCVIVKGGHADHVVDLLDFRCDCDFSVSMRLPCRHAMAYRKYSKQGAVIPLKRIDVRWKRAESKPSSVSPFVYTRASSASTRRVDVPHDARGRYNEAMRHLQPICSELADVEDENEFRAYIELFQAQYQNGRKRKRVGVSTDEGDSTRPASRSKQQQDRASPQCETPSLRQHSTAASEDATNDVTSSPRQDSTAPSEEPPAHMDLSQANSLYSEALGSVPHPVLRDLDISSPQELLASETIPGESLVIPGEEKDSIQTGHHEEKDELGGSVEGGDIGCENANLRIGLNFNEHAPKTGRRKNVLREIVSADHQERVRFNAAEKVRRATGEFSLKDIVNALDQEQPGLVETMRRLEGVQVKFQQSANNKPKYSRLRDPTINQDAYYILPAKLLAACVKVLPLATGAGEVLRVGTPATPDVPTGGAAVAAPGDNLVEVVTIKGVGLFTRHQIEVMRRVEILKSQSVDGEECVKWLRLKVTSLVSPSQKADVISIVDEMDSLYPGATIPHLQRYTEYQVAALYRIMPPVWFNDGVIAAFCERLQEAHPGIKYAGIVGVSKGRRAIQDIPAGIKDRVCALAAEDDTTLIAIPVNFGDFHWTVICEDMGMGEVKFYDSTNTATMVKALKTMACGLIDDEGSPFQDFTAVELNSPIQLDGHSCGLFVCLKIWREVNKSIPRDTSSRALELRRFDVLHFLLRGHPMP